MDDSCAASYPLGNAIGGLANANSRSIPKSVTIEQVANGFIVRTVNQDSWGSNTSIAKTTDEVAQIIKKYLS